MPQSNARDKSEGKKREEISVMQPFLGPVRSGVAKVEADIPAAGRQVESGQRTARRGTSPLTTATPRQRWNVDGLGHNGGSHFVPQGPHGFTGWA